jgi:hypothetical protein
MQAEEPERYGDPTTDPTHWAAREIAAALAETKQRRPAFTQVRGRFQED